MKRTWWKEAVIYQIYPRSFYDSNGDGIGDIPGIISKLDYLKYLGVDVIWLCPVYKSPNDDNGYDISDYRDIMDEFGTMADWEQLLQEMHRRGIRLVMDLVVNHSSDEHAWFVESRKSKDNDKRDYYIWRPGKGTDAAEGGETAEGGDATEGGDAAEGGEPNNWASFFTPSAWTYDAATGEYYLHLFSEKQPDLNWKNPTVRGEVYGLMKFWLDKGIDGFRMDVINCISKVPGLPSVPSGSNNEKYMWAGDYFMNGPKVHDYLREMNERVLSKYDIMTVGETPAVTPEDGILYTDESRGELNMLFQFELMDIDAQPEGKWFYRPWKLTEFKVIMGKWQTELHGRGWNSLYLNNHDQPRMVSRFGDDGRYRVESAKMLATLLHTLEGTPYIYQGEEIGMTNVRFDSIDDYRDIETLNKYHVMTNEWNMSPEEAMKLIYFKGRDNARTPMQWDEGVYAGFSESEPWIGVNPNYTEINVKRSISDENSIFHYYRKLISLRKQNPALIYGEYIPVDFDNEQVYSYLRVLGDERFLVILNFYEAPVLFEMPDGIEYKTMDLILSNYAADLPPFTGKLELRPYEARIYRF